MSETDPPTMPPIPVKVVGIPGTETQKVMPLPPGSSVTAVTPSSHQPDFHVQVISPLLAVFVRVAYAFLLSYVGLLTAAMTPEGQRHLYTSDFVHLLRTCADLSLPIAGLGLLKDMLTIFQKLEGKYRLLDR